MGQRFKGDANKRITEMLFLSQCAQDMKSIK
ncbi:MAG: hypothetical protein CFH42_01575 [Alphaproteobacteria bacterium MarineAlpha12_Bin1]|nr:MAG: hypothetical protein CFH42_01575 [Alphaproteobacteria bacterium MarineAlpha12_Bin1]